MAELSIEEKDRLMGTALAGAEAIQAVMRIPVEDLEVYDRHARAHANRTEALSPILGLEHGAIAVAHTVRADAAAARAAEGLLAFRRVLEEVRSR